MSLKIRSEERVALLVTAAASVLFVIGMLAELPVVIVIIFAIIVYLVTLTTVRHFVAYKIKPIYRIMYQRNANASEIKSKHRDLSSEVKSDLQIWAERNSSEIARLKDNEQYRKDFLGNVSHELKTPIFSIQGYVLTLLDGGLDDPTINRKYLLKTESNIERLINIVKDLEEISKLETPDLVLEQESFDVVDLTHELIESVEFQAQERGIVITTECEEDDAYVVKADRKRISQVIVNLLTNSIKYGREGGRTRVRFTDLYDKIMVEVEDDGQGMERDVLPRIFERFYRVDKGRSRTQGGTGLGLAIVKHIIEAHKQTITVRSTPNVGTTFSFTLDKGDAKL